MSCFHPWETGTDNSPAFEPLLARTRAYMAEHQIPIDTFGRVDNRRVAAEHRPTEKDYTAYFGLMALFKQQHYDQARIGEAMPFLLEDVLFNSCWSLRCVRWPTWRKSWRSCSTLRPRRAARQRLPAELRRLATANRRAAGRVSEAIRSPLWSEEDGLSTLGTLAGGSSCRCRRSPR